jgi:excisionase family DNA binding protein
MDASTYIESDGASKTAHQLLLTPEQAAAALAICRTKVYELLRNGQLESVRIESSRRIPMAAAVEFVRRLRDDIR